MRSWSEYVSNLTAGVGNVAAGKLVGVSDSTISRWKNGLSLPRNPAEAASLAKEFGGNVLEAFVAAGYLTPEQAKIRPHKSLQTVPGAALAREVTRRLAAADEEPAYVEVKKSVRPRLDPKE